MMKIATKSIVGDNVVFTWADGKVQEVGLKSLPKDIVTRLALHGLSQKIGDSYASAESLSEAKENASSVIANLTAGNWTTVGRGGNVVTAAIARVMNISVEVAEENYSALDDEQKATVRKDVRITRMVAKIKAERLEAKLAAMPEVEVPFTLPTAKK